MLSNFSVLLSGFAAQLRKGNAAGSAANLKRKRLQMETHPQPLTPKLEIRFSCAPRV
jgi:hypothetical protein